MTTASIHFRKEGEPTTGWLCEFAVVPQIGEEIRLLDAQGADEAYGTVTAVIHTMVGSADYRAGGQMIEVYLDA